MQQEILTVEGLLAVGKKGSYSLQAGMEFIARHKGVLKYQTAIDMRDLWVKNNCPSKFIALKSIVSKMTTMGILDRNPLRGIPNPLVKHRVRPTIVKDDWLKLLEASKETYIYPLILGLYRTGLSFIDVCLLQWKEVDVEAGVIRRVRQKMKNRNGRECIIPLDPNGPYLEWLRNAHEFKDSTLGVYPSVNGVHYVANDLAIRVLRGEKRQTVIYRTWKEVRRKAGLEEKGIQIHDFRAHTCSTLVRHMNPLLVCQITGHTDLSVLQRYMVPDQSNLQSLMAGVFEKEQ